MYGYTPDYQDSLVVLLVNLIPLETKILSFGFTVKFENNFSLTLIEILRCGYNKSTDLKCGREEHRRQRAPIEGRKMEFGRGKKKLEA